VRLSGFEDGARGSYMQRLQAELGAIPGVVAVGASHAGPFSRWNPSNFVARSDQEPDRQEDFVPVSWRGVSGSYFDAAGVALLDGRVFGPQDGEWAVTDVPNPPVVIDENLAGLLFPGERAVGRLLTWFLPGGRQCEVVGVVAAVRDERVDQVPRPRIYRPYGFSGWDQPSVLVRVAGEPAAYVARIREAVLALDPDVPAIAPAPVEQRVAASVAWPRFTTQVLVVFGLIALGLASMGIYGITSFAVGRRRREIGVRVALGAAPGGVVWMVVRSAARLALLGIGVGLLVSLAAGRFLEAQLYDLSPRDPVTWFLVPLVLGAVALASAWIPARRGAFLDPTDALTTE
jgi:predicted permease